jgi:hypothetical protein
MSKVVKFIPKAVFDKIEELGGVPEAISNMREAEAIWELPIEKRQAAYNALKAKYGEDFIAMSVPGLSDD